MLAGRAHVPSFFQSGLINTCLWPYPPHLPSKISHGSSMPIDRSIQIKAFKAFQLSLSLIFIEVEWMLVYSLCMPWARSLLLCSLPSITAWAIFLVFLIFGMNDAPMDPLALCIFLHCCMLMHDFAIHFYMLSQIISLHSKIFTCYPK